MNPILKIQNLYKSYSKKSVLNGLNLKVEQGTVVGLLGKNGAGKSTLLHCILGIEAHDDGQITVFNEDNQSITAATKQKIGFVAQTPDEFMWMTVSQLLKFKSQFYENWDQPWVDDYLIQWELEHTDKIADLSQGQLQRLALIIGMAHHPELLIFDEPVSALDPAARRNFLKQIIDMSNDGKSTVFLSTHITSDLERVASHIAILHDGQIGMAGALDEIKESTKRLLLSSDQVDLSDMVIPNAITQKGDQKQLQATVTKVDRNWLQQKNSEGIEIKEYALSLEDIFLEITQ